FDAKQINAELNPLGYVYSSGYGVFNKPHFFLGQLKKTYKKNDVTIYISTCEYARDLVAPPAMSQGDTIFIREESLRRMIWEKIEEWQWKQDQDTAMARVLRYYRKENDVERILDHLCENESNNVLLHEIGETEAGNLLGHEWEEMLNEMPRSKTELQIRAVRDHLADCISTLPALLEAENIPSLHFYFANFTAMRKELFPSAINAYKKWVETGNLTHIDKMATEGQHYWRDLAKQVLATWRASRDQGQGAEPFHTLEKLIQPL
ncbi:Sfum_1244 family protein, partial [Kaarinaea lacus]